jgi:hypothetical protein
LKTLARYPALREALLWALPALCLALIVRGLFLSYSPFAYWGSDSRSYYEFTHKLFDFHAISLNEKRRFLYPILLALIELLPGSILRALAALQHAFGVITLVPLAYIIRKTFVHWRWLIVPVTLLYATFPIVLWYEHELLAENIFFALILWSFAGWVAWVNATPLAWRQRLWWLFFVPFALVILLKPSARFYWPGIALGLLAVAAWRVLTLRQSIALVALMIVTLFVGSKRQGAWLLYVGAFPLTRLETPLHHDYKVEIADMVKYYREHLDAYYDLDEKPFEFLRSPTLENGPPLWRKLDGDGDRQAKVYMQLALEGIKARPDLFFYIGAQRFIASMNLANFKEFRFTSRYLPERFRDDYETACLRLSEGRTTPIPRVLGFPSSGPLPPYEVMAQRFAPKKENSFGERIITGMVSIYQRIGNFMQIKGLDQTNRKSIKAARPTALGWWFLVSIALTLLPRYRMTFGVWTIATIGALFGIFCVSQMNPRYFGSGWPVFIPMMAIPIDVALTLVTKQLWPRSKRDGEGSPM